MSTIDIQYASIADDLPSEAQLRDWCHAALLDHNQDAELTLRIVDEREIQNLNRQFRHKDKPTNVLSFPSDLPPEIKLETKLLGDVIICSNVVKREAMEQNKSLNAHWSHMVVHGTLHLQGYDHIVEAEAVEMEGIESRLMLALGFSDPYQIEHE